MRNRVRQFAVIVRESRGALPDRPARKSPVGRELEADELRLQPVHGGASQRPVLAVEQVAVGCLALEQAGDFVDEPLDHSLELELTGHDLRRAQKRRLLQQTLPVLVE